MKSFKIVASFLTLIILLGDIVPVIARIEQSTIVINNTIEETSNIDKINNDIMDNNVIIDSEEKYVNDTVEEKENTNEEVNIISKEKKYFEEGNNQKEKNGENIEEINPIIVQKAGKAITSGVRYQTLMQTWDWRSYTGDGETNGKPGQGMNMHTIKIQLVNPENNNAHIAYQVYQQGKGWQNWVKDNEEAGGDGVRRIEGIRIKLENMENYTVKYRVHIQGLGWQPWSQDEESAGIIGRQIEAIQIKVVEKETELGVRYSLFMQPAEWLGYAGNGETNGKPGQGMNMHSIKVKLVGDRKSNQQIEYQVYKQEKGWQNWTKEDEEAGGDWGLRITAIKIRLIDIPNYSVEYRAYMKGIGWQEWRTDGEAAGIESSNYVLEAIEIRLVKREKTGIFGKLFVDIPDEKKIKDNELEISGWSMATEGNTLIKVYIDNQEIKNKIERIEREDIIETIGGYGSATENPTPGFKTVVNLLDYTRDKHTINVKLLTKQGQLITEQSKEIDTSIKVEYQTFMQPWDWREHSENGETNGKPGQGMNMHTIKMDIYGLVQKNQHITYQVYIEGKGWQNAVKDNEEAGRDTVRRIEGFRINLENMPEYSVTYNSYIEGIGWQGWAIDGEISGIIGKRLEAIQIKIIPKVTENKLHLEIEKPYNIGEVVKVTKGKNEISGWFLSNKDEASIKILIDEKEVSTNIERIERQDILDRYKGYGGVEKNPLPGYKTYLNFGDYNVGTIHKVDIQAVDLEDNILLTKSFKVQISPITYGIDVSHHNNLINWNLVSKTQDFAMIRVGYRGYETGNIVYDRNFLTNIMQAQVHGIKIGIYFYTQAVNEQEAIEEANWVADAIAGYNVTYPIAIDTEWSNGDRDGRADGISVDQRTKNMIAFLNTIKSRGYKSAIYASKNWFEEQLYDDKLSNYDRWVAHYTGGINNPTNYEKPYAIWQYTSSGCIPGINGNVDLNICYKEY